MTAQEKQKKPGPKRKPPIREEDIQGFKYLDCFFKTLTRLHDVQDHQNRKLHYDQYLAMMLLYFFTHVLTSLRGIQQATTLEKIQKRLGMKKTSLGSLSPLFLPCRFDMRVVPDFFVFRDQNRTQGNRRGNDYAIRRVIVQSTRQLD